MTTLPALGTSTLSDAAGRCELTVTAYFRGLFGSLELIGDRVADAFDDADHVSAAALTDVVEPLAAATLAEHPVVGAGLRRAPRLALRPRALPRLVAGRGPAAAGRARRADRPPRLRLQPARVVRDAPGHRRPPRHRALRRLRLHRRVRPDRHGPGPRRRPDDRCRRRRHPPRDLRAADARAVAGRRRRGPRQQPRPLRGRRRPAAPLGSEAQARVVRRRASARWPAVPGAERQAEHDKH